MQLIPYVDSNKFIPYLIIQLLKLKAIKSYTELINETVKNIIAFSKDIKEITGLDILHYRKILKKVIIPNTIIEIHQNAFYGCVLLENIIIPDSVSLIEYMAFGECNKLKEITIPKSVKHLSIRAFAKCLNLKKIILPSKFKNFLQLDLKYLSTYIFY